MVLCVLAADEEDEHQVALQIHFTLLQAFCREVQIDVLRVSGIRRLAEALGEPAQNNKEAKDLHCVLVTVRDGALLLHIQSRWTVDSVTLT